MECHSNQLIIAEGGLDLFDNVNPSPKKPFVSPKKLCGYLCGSEYFL